MGIKWRRATVDSLRSRGFSGTAKRAVAYCKLLLVHQWKLYSRWNPWNPWYSFLDRRFDRRFAVDTAGVLLLPEIHSDPRFNGYSPTPHSFFSRLLHQVDIDYSQFTFIDFGCGKGKALLLASKLPFRRIVGVEVSSVLIGVAAENLKTYRGTTKCKTVQLVCSDARDFQLPEEKVLCYFWDPFEADVMQTIVENIRNSLAAAPRDIYVVYFMPVHRKLFDEADFLTLVKQASWYCIYRASGGVFPA